MSEYEPRICKRCGTAFSARHSDIARGRAQFCSLRCSNIRPGAPKGQRHYYSKVPARPEVPTTPRRCLACSATFASVGAGNRICARCKNSDAWASASGALA